MKEKDFPKAAGASERMELYCMAHPRSPSAVRRPRLLLRNGTFVALLGPSVTEGIAGFGSTVEHALQAFDAQYLAALSPLVAQRAKASGKSKRGA
jgi:hypothetical protein